MSVCLPAGRLSNCLLHLCCAACVHIAALLARIYLCCICMKINYVELYRIDLHRALTLWLNCEITLWFVCLDGLIQTHGEFVGTCAVFGSGHPNTETIK